MERTVFVCKENFKYFYRLFERHSAKFSVQPFKAYYDEISVKPEGYINAAMFSLLIDLWHLDNFKIYDEIRKDFPNVTDRQIMFLFKKFFSVQG